ncbi:hypothetical protein WJX72_011041 [[Myrmecia] bisecta]|uniref:VOC domain-containing protein n=1 Tax=[Myrmecia] bisecta TaxID=41462 RepID=A0AAW1PTP9_9CHLO
MATRAGFVSTPITAVVHPAVVPAAVPVRTYTCIARINQRRPQIKACRAAAQASSSATKTVPPFHLAFPVHDVAAAKDFYGSKLGCPEGRSAASWVDYNLYGHQIVCHHIKGYNAASTANDVDGDPVPVPHFGLALSVDQFHELAERVRQSDIEFVLQPHIRFQGAPGEQWTMFFRDPSGNALEFKAMTNPENLFKKGQRKHWRAPSGKFKGGKSAPKKPARLDRSVSAGELVWRDLQQTALNPFESSTSDETQEDARNRRSGFHAHEGGMFRGKLGSLWGRLLYSYYNWRKDSWSDLQLFALMNMLVIFCGALVKHFWVNQVDMEEAQFSGTWQDIYKVLVLIFGSNFPEASASAPNQVFSLVMAACGLMAFALVLALVEQVVLDVVEENVKQGGRVFETGHIVVLSWGQSQHDIEVVWKILSQICLAYRNEGGRVVVVLSQTAKLEMEEMFWRTVPIEERHGTSFVFRQGSPLVPDDLRMVAASAAAVTIVVADSSRAPEEADAQSLRAAVLLDELDFPGFGVRDPRRGAVVVEMKTMDALPLLHFSCSKRILGVPTNNLNARRLARMVCHPVVAEVSKMMWNFNSQSQTYMQHFPQLVGRSFAELVAFFPEGICLGLLNSRTGDCAIAPPPDRLVGPMDDLIMIRPSSISAEEYQPLEEAADVHLDGWHPMLYYQSYDADQNGSATPDQPRTAPVAVPSLLGGMRLRSDGVADGKVPLPVEYRLGPEVDGIERLLICGWGETSFMSDLLRELDRGPAALAPGSEVTLLNIHEGYELFARIKRYNGGDLKNIRLHHVRCNPLKRHELAQVDVASFKCAMVLCDTAWMDPDNDASNGIELHEQRDFLRMDAMVMLVHLNIRKLLEAACHPELNIICEKVAFEGVTRFEDGSRLPLSVSSNFRSHAAKILLEIAYNPKVLVAYSKLTDECELLVQETAAFAMLDEEINFWQLQLRAQAVDQVLVGYYEIPQVITGPIVAVVNPVGLTSRLAPRVWNDGQQRIKLLTFCSTKKGLDEIEGNETELNYIKLSADEADMVVVQPVEDQLSVFLREELSVIREELSAFRKDTQVPRKLLRSIHAAAVAEAGKKLAWFKGSGHVDFSELNKYIGASKNKALSHSLMRLRNVVTLSRQQQALLRCESVGIMCVLAAAHPKLYLNAGRNGLNVPAEELEFDAQGKVELPMGKHYAYIDIGEAKRSLDYRTSVKQLGLNLGALRWTLQTAFALKPAQITLVGRLFVTKENVEVMSGKAQLVDLALCDWGYSLFVHML